MKMRHISKVLLLAATLMMTACATMMSGGSTQTVYLQAIDSKNHKIIPGAMCTITDDKGRVYAFNSNPGSVIVTKNKGALSVTCQKAGYRQAQIGVGQSFNAWTIADVIFWPGIIVDAVTGAVTKYPSHITVLMTPKGK
jgi:hypothetical protein